MKLKIDEWMLVLFYYLSFSPALCAFDVGRYQERKKTIKCGECQHEDEHKVVKQQQQKHSNNWIESRFSSQKSSVALGVLIEFNFVFVLLQTNRSFP